MAKSIHGDYEEILGRKFNRLLVVEYAGTKPRGHSYDHYYKCQCDCGNTTIVEKNKIASGHTKSCGCYNRERAKTINFKTGKSTSRIYLTYRNMINRCYYKKLYEYHLYGGRGIEVCDEWRGEHGFENFYDWAMQNGYTDELTIDRIDNDKNYEPNNCRWVDKYVQANNKSTTKYVKVNGEVGTVANLARKHNISYWNLLHYSKGGQNCKYPNLKIEVVNVN